MRIIILIYIVLNDLTYTEEEKYLRDFNNKVAMKKLTLTWQD